MYQPKFIITNQILKNIGEIEAAKEVIESSPIVPAFEKQFQTDAIQRTIHHGTHIEGNELTFDQTRKVLEGQEVYARARDIQEVINYRNVTTLVDELAVKRSDYSLDMLLEIHKLTVDKIVSEDKVGVLRTTQVVIKDEATGQIMLEPPPFVQVPFMLEDYFKWLNSPQARELHPNLRAAISHYILVAIHPFVEGNGRSVRSFSTLILLREGYDIKRLFSLEEHFDSDPAAYYNALGAVSSQSKNIGARDLTPWLEYFTHVVAIELTKIKDKIRKLSMDTRLRVKIGEQITLSERQMKLIEYITNQGNAVMKELNNVLPMVSEDTILRDLGRLIEKGIIKKEGTTKASRYIMVK